MNLSLPWYLGLLLLVSCSLWGHSALAQSAFDATVRGASCKQGPTGALNCNYKVGGDLEFSITDAGAADVGISFLRSNIKGDYYARFGPMHGCVIVAQGEATTSSAPVDFAFVSPKNGKVYRTWPECQAPR